MQFLFLCVSLGLRITAWSSRIGKFNAACLLIEKLCRTAHVEVMMTLIFIGIVLHRVVYHGNIVLEGVIERTFAGVHVSAHCDPIL